MNEEAIVVVECWDDENKAYRPITLHGTVWNINGFIVEIFRIGTMAKAVGRSVSMLRKWERNGKFPKPLFQSEKERIKFQSDNESAYDRYYSKYQILQANRLAKKHQILIKKRVKQEFFDELKASFYKEREKIESMVTR